MYDRYGQNENTDRQDEARRRADEARRVQQELEQQIREFGETVSDAAAHGFVGRGEEIGDRAWDMGRATFSYVNQRVSDSLRRAADVRERKARTGDPSMTTGDWAQIFFGQKNEPTPVENIRASAKKRRSAGLAMAIIGGIFAFSFGIAGIACLATAGAWPTMFTVSDVIVSDVIVTTNVFSGVQGVLNITGGVLSAVGAGFVALLAKGIGRIKAARRLNAYADAADGANIAEGIPVRYLADFAHETTQKTRKLLRRFMNRGWLSAWLDENTDTLYLTVEDYRAAHDRAVAAHMADQARQQAEQAAKAAAEAEEKAPLNLETVRRFTAVIGSEKALMKDARAVEELDHMQKTAQAICDWLEAHPESLPKTRRFAEYYIPTTLKLLHTYNDVQGQQGENAEAIRRDIAGILHTLNQAFDNLYDNLLSDVALDVSSEIAALEGMLANDGLTGEGLR